MLNRKRPIKLLLRIFIVASFALGIAAQSQEGERNRKSKVVSELGFLFEYFELDHRVANKLIREYSTKAADAQGLKDRLTEMVEKGDSTLVETSWFRARSGQRAKTESIRETIYPTEFDPPEIPNSLGVASVAQKKTEGKKPSANQPVPLANAPGSPATGEILMTSATPTAFETRNVGITIEADAVFTNDSKLVTVSLAPEIVSLEGRHFFTRSDVKNVPWGVDHISMPLIYSMQTSLQLKTIPGNYSLLGMFTPPNKPDKKMIGLLRVDLIHTN